MYGDSPLSALPSAVEATPTLLVQELAGEAVILDLQSDQYFGLDDVATRMWQLLREHASPEAIIPILLDEYEVDEATLRRDLADLIESLAERGLIQVTP